LPKVNFKRLYLASFLKLLEIKKVIIILPLTPQSQTRAIRQYYFHIL